MSNDPENDNLNYEDIEEIPDINENMNGSENKDISKRLINAGQIEEETVMAKIEDITQEGSWKKRLQTICDLGIRRICI